MFTTGVSGGGAWGFLGLLKGLGGDGSGYFNNPFKNLLRLQSPISQLNEENTKICRTGAKPVQTKISLKMTTEFSTGQGYSISWHETKGGNRRRSFRCTDRSR